MTTPKAKTLITAAGGRVGGVSNHIISLLLNEGVPIRAVVHTEDERAEELRKKGVEVVAGDLAVPSFVNSVMGKDLSTRSFPSPPNTPSLPFLSSFPSRSLFFVLCPF
jgi:hypothetical protein